MTLPQDWFMVEEGMKKTGNYHLQCFDSPENLAASSAREWVKVVGETSEKPAFHVAVSGGRIAVPFLQEAARLFMKSPVLLNRLNVYWADERCVPPDSEDSNYKMFQRHFVHATRFPESQMYRFEGESDPEHAAKWMSANLEENLPSDDSNIPIFDLVILGMGEDGHVASLFPENMEEDVKKTDHAFSVIASKPPPQRLTLSYPVLHAARHVWVVISGQGKEKALLDSLKCNWDNPLALVIQGRVSTEIFTDIDHMTQFA